MTSLLIAPKLIGDLGTGELLLIFAVIVLLFGASKLPDLARGSGQALRIFKAETKELREKDEEPGATRSAQTRVQNPTHVTDATSDERPVDPDHNG